MRNPTDCLKVAKQIVSETLNIKNVVLEARIANALLDSYYIGMADSNKKFAKVKEEKAKLSLDKAS